MDAHCPRIFIKRGHRPAVSALGENDKDTWTVREAPRGHDKSSRTSVAVTSCSISRIASPSPQGEVGPRGSSTISISTCQFTGWPLLKFKKTVRYYIYHSIFLCFYLCYPKLVVLPLHSACQSINSSIACRRFSHEKMNYLFVRKIIFLML